MRPWRQRNGPLRCGLPRFDTLPKREHPFAMELFIFRDRDSRPEEWRVEAIDTDGDGSCEVSLFSGPGAEARARGYAAWRHPGAVPRRLRTRSPRLPWPAQA